MVTAMISERDVKAIRASAKTEDERFWAEALDRASRTLLLAAHDVLKAAEEGRLVEALSLYGYNMSVVSSMLLYSEAINQLQKLTGTRRIVTETLQNQTRTFEDARADLEPEDAAIIDDINEGFFERIRLRNLDPLLNHEEGAIRVLDSGEVMFRGDFLAEMTKDVLLVFVTARALKISPKSAGAKRVYRVLLERCHHKVAELAQRLGLGKEPAITVKASELIESDSEPDEAYEAISEDALNKLLDKYN